MKSEPKLFCLSSIDLKPCSFVGNGLNGTKKVSDIAIDPENESVWYVAMGSSGVWKTSNAGVTWKPIFDGQQSFSIGCVSIDPSNHHTIWVGTGENNGGRHISYGDGIYRSKDGKSFLSLINPNEWNREHLGSYKLNTNGTWEKIDYGDT